MLVRILIALVVLLWASTLAASEFRAEILPHLFPGVKGELRAGATSGDPPAAEVTLKGELVGYALSTRAITGSVGFSGRPIDVHLGLTRDGRIAGARLVAHQEPILVIGVAPTELEAFVSRLAGIDLRQAVSVYPAGRRTKGGYDHVAGATASSAVIRDAVIRSARSVALSRGLLGPSAQMGGIDRTTYAARSWQALLDAGGVAHRRLTRGEVAKGLGMADSKPGELFVDVYAALLTPPMIGQNLLGQRAFERLYGGLGVDDHAVLIAASGLYSFKGTAWRQSEVFDRVQLVQGARTIRLRADMHENVQKLVAAGAPELREIAIFRIPGSTGFDPERAWRVELIVERENAQGGAPTAIFPLDYTLPAQLIVAGSTPANKRDGSLGAAPSPELWEQIWQSRKPEIAIVIAMLVALAAILFSHDVLTRNVVRYRAIRLAYLSITLLFLGLYAGAQLSVVNVVTFVHAILGGFRWEQFLLNPLIFILWSFVALALLFWGRGVFCGWLCPFGALQELLNKGARRLGIRQIELPWALHERLWPIKYVAFLVILGLSLKSLTLAFVIAEIEPFKTAITLRFMRDWSFVLYVVGLLGAGLFIERLYCRYLCPLGAALAIPARLRLFEWLKRRPQCGRECRICATRCTVQAINPLGQIVPNECIYCLQCQANYYDPETCLPLKQRAQRRSGLASRAAGAWPQDE
ncbi:MAG: regulatory protein NosR [Hyphomicrobiaceae bacterium]|nr:MAG: regulatory protein NosR [Hyphomicrobiaceae bacterium]